MNGEVYGWGNNSKGVLALGDSSDKLINYYYPVQIEYSKLILLFIYLLEERTCICHYYQQEN